MTDLAGIQQAIQKLAEKTAEQQAQSGGATPAAASQGDVEQLQAALNRPAEAAAKPEAAQAVEGAAATSSTPGAKILDHLNNVRQSFNEAVHELQSAVEKSVDSPSELLKVQMKLQQVTLQQDLLGKVTAKSEQNIDTLLKGQ